MMPPPLYGVWLWFKSNPTAQWIAGIGLAYITFRIWLATKVQAVRKDEQQKIEIKAQEASRKVIDKAKDKTNETIRKADDARADIPRGTPSGELPERVQNVLFDD
jgi:Skp family chaperone for outer membrane proteins